MRSLLGALVLALVAGNAYAQADAFVGTWKVDPTKSTANVGQLAKQELLIIEVKDGSEHATNDIIGPDGVRRKSHYTAKYNDGQWYTPSDVETGKPSTGMVMMVRADPHTELRIGKNAAGKYTGTIMRQVSEDGKKMTITWGGADGKVNQLLILDKQP